MQHCYVKYNELYRCYSVKGKEGEECARIKKDMRCVDEAAAAAGRSGRCTAPGPALLQCLPRCQLDGSLHG